MLKKDLKMSMTSTSGYVFMCLRVVMCVKNKILKKDLKRFT